MIYWKCENKECDDFEKEIIEVKPTFKYVSGVTVPINIPYCKCCNKQMGWREELPESNGSISVAFASFDSKSDSDKATVLKKRYREDMKKNNIEEVIKLKREQVTKSYFGE